jgi:hypothetical protein
MAPAYPDGHEIAPGHGERMALNAMVIVPKPPDPPPPAPSEPTTTTTAPGAGDGSGTDEPDAGGDGGVATDGGRLQPVGPTGEAFPSEGDPGFFTAGGGLRRLVTPALDRGQSRGKNGKGKSSDAIGNLNGDWLPGMPPLPGDTRDYSALPDGPAEEEGPPLSLAFTAGALRARQACNLRGQWRRHRERGARPPAGSG